MILFWIEYFQYTFSKKRITFQFEPSFDSTTVSSSAIRELGSDEETEEKDNKMRRHYLKKLKRRIKEI